MRFPDSMKVSNEKAYNELNTYPFGLEIELLDALKESSFAKLHTFEMSWVVNQARSGGPSCRFSSWGQLLNGSTRRSEERRAILRRS